MQVEPDLGYYVLLQASRERNPSWVILVAAAIIRHFRSQEQTLGKSLAVLLDFRRIEVVPLGPLLLKMRRLRNAPRSLETLQDEWRNGLAQDLQDIKSELAGQASDEFGRLARLSAAWELHPKDDRRNSND